MRTSALAVALLLAICGCTADPGDQGDQFWVEGSDPVVLRGTAPGAIPESLEIRGILRYDSASRCLLVERYEENGDSAIYESLIWHLEVTAVKDGELVTVEIETQHGKITLQDGDLIAGYFAPASLTVFDGSAPCPDEHAASVFSISNLSQSELELRN